MMSVTTGRPTVNVPVLSNSSTRPAASRSSARPPFTTTPREAIRVSPEVIAIGAARIKGQGVATTRTATARTASPDNVQASPATARVTARNATAYRSASLTNGALDASASASATNRTIPAYVLSAARRVARIMNESPAFTAPLRTPSPAPTFDGKGLPRQRRLVEHRDISLDTTVDGHDLTRPHQQQVTWRHVFDGR